jgi:hypothetical protein
MATSAEPHDRHGPLGEQEAAVRDAREAADEHVLGIAGEGRHASHVRRGGEGDQVGHGRQGELARQAHDQGGQHDAHDVVHEERGEDTGGHDHGPQQAAWRSRPPRHPRHHEREEPGQAKVGGDDHHAEQQDQRVGVHAGYRLVPREDAAHDHRRRTDDGDPRTIDPEPGEAAEREAEIRPGEDAEREEPRQLVRSGRGGSWRSRRPRGCGCRRRR